MGLSRADQLRAMPPDERREVLEKLGPERCASLKHDWRFWARPEQIEPGTEGSAIDREDWTFWLILAGRGFGKTRAGAEWSIEQARNQPGSHGALVAGTAADAKKTMVSYGQEHQPDASGILAISPPDFTPKFEPSKLMLTWPNGSTAALYSAEEPERLRGPQHHWAWPDELGAWKRNAQATWDNMMFGLRLGNRVRVCITTTPRPKPVIISLTENPRTVITAGSTYDNRENLAPDFFNSLIDAYEGTRIGRQELWAELLLDVPGALWNLTSIDRARINEAPADLERIVVAIDPAVTSNEDSDETGIVVAGRGSCTCKAPDTEMHGFVLEDASGVYTPLGWATRAVEAYDRWNADRIVAEVNNGGDMVEATIRQVRPDIPYTAVHASRGKAIRAEPVAALYEQLKVHHCGLVMSNGARKGALVRLEDQMCKWDPAGGGKSPDRMDALVWALTSLLVGRKKKTLPDNIAFPDLTQTSRWRI